MGNILVVDDTDNKVYKHSGFSNTIIDSIVCANNTPLDLSWDGTNLLSNGSFGTDKYYQHSGFTTTLNDSLTIDSPYGTGWDGTNLLTCQYGSNVRLHSGFSTTIDDSFNTSRQDVEWDGSNVIARLSNKHYQFSGFSSTISDSFTKGGTNRGDAWNSTGLIRQNYDIFGKKVYQHSGFSTTVSDSFTFSATINNPTGVTDDSWSGVATPSGPAGVKTINELAIASVKTIQQTVIANVKTINESAA